MKSYKIHLIRHGQTDANVEGRFAGVTDAPLNEHGRRELERLKDEFSYPGAGEIFSSPLSRAKDTAEIIYPGRNCVTVPELRECNFGIFENKNADELKNNKDFDEWISSGMTKAPPLGESSEVVAKRSLCALEHIIGIMMEKKITSAAAVTHGGIILTLMLLCDIDVKSPEQYFCGNGKGFTVLVTPQLWQNAKKFELLEQIPDGASVANWEAFGFAELDDEKEK